MPWAIQILTILRELVDMVRSSKLNGEWQVYSLSVHAVGGSWTAYQQCRYAYD